jgi:hypothetical protein
VSRVYRGGNGAEYEGGGKSAGVGVVGGGFRALVGVVVTTIVFLISTGGP